MRTAILTGLAISALLWAESAAARRQPIADDTLGAEQSLVTPTEINGVLGHLITEGAQRDSNLFHSFQAFSIDEGRAAYFANPDGVENIFGRVTGGNPSDILGRLGVLGEANLFLINPNGILFGPNASLDIGGSFLATTADAVGFGEQGWFSATAPEVPSPLLTIHPSAFFYNQMQTSPITVRSTAPIDSDLGTIGLAVGAGENLALLGGDITVEDEGGLNARGGRIDLGAVASSGTIGFNADGSFAFPKEVQRGTITFIESARADVRAPTSGGDIAITAQRIGLVDRSELRAGTLPGQGFLGSQGGDIRLDATEQIWLTQASSIQTGVDPNSQGNAGAIKINISLEVRWKGLFAGAYEQGNAESTSSSSTATSSLEIAPPPMTMMDAPSSSNLGSIGDRVKILQVCPTVGSRTAMSLQNEFVVTGRGGLPPNPLSLLEGDGILAGWASLDDEFDTAPIALLEQPVDMPAERAIVEATSWRRDAGGNVVLMAGAGIAQLPLAMRDGVGTSPCLRGENDSRWTMLTLR